MSASASPLPRLARLWCLALAMALAMPLAPGTGGPAHAQQAGERQSGGGLLRFLFQRPEPARQERAAPRQAAPRQAAPRRAASTRRTQQAAGRPARTAQPAQPAAVDKAEDARRVLVVGDFLAGGLAEGLAAAFAQNANVVVADRSNGSSGLVRDDYYDWPGRIDDIIEAEKPAAVVVMIGSNDRQQMRVEGRREERRSEAWTSEYERRVTALVKSVRDRNLPLVWVGNLPFQSGAMSSDMIAFNDIYRRIVTDAGGEFVDVWDGFVDENGAYLTNGPDMNGQPAQLRAGDGINVTRQGRRKIAFYAERPLARLLGSAAGGAVEPARPDALIEPGPDPSAFHGPVPGRPVPARIDRTAPVAIDDPDLDGGSDLLGGFVAPRAGQAGALVEQLGREGVAPEARAGRADDFSRRQAAKPAATDPETTTALTP